MITSQQQRLFSTNYLITFFVSILTWSSSMLLTASIPLYLAKTFHSSSAEIGLILGISSLSPIVVRPFMGYALDRFGRRKVLLAAQIAMVVSNLLYLVVRSPAGILFVRLAYGAPFAAASTALITIASDILPVKRMGEGLSYFTSASTLAMAVAPGIGVGLFNSGTLLPFIAAVGVSGVCLLCGLLIAIPRHDPKVESFSLAGIFDRRILILATILMVCYLGIPGLLNYGVFYAEEISLPLKSANWAYTLYASGILATRLVTGRRMDKQNPALSGIISILLYTVSIFLMGAWRTSTGLYVSSFLLGGGMGILLPTLLIMALDLAPEKRGLSSALIYGGLDTGNSIGAFLFGVIAGWTNSYGNTYLVFSLFELSALFLFIFITLPMYRKKELERTGVK